MQIDIPMFLLLFPSIVLESSRISLTISMNKEIEANTFLAFICNGLRLEQFQSAVRKTSCTGNLCDKQRIIDLCGSQG